MKVKPLIAKWRDDLIKTMDGGKKIEPDDEKEEKEAFGSYMCQMKFKWKTNINEYEDKGE